MFCLKGTKSLAYSQKYQHVIRLRKKLSGNVLSTRRLSKLSVDDGIAVWELDRPPVNSMNLDVFNELVNVLDQADEKKWKGLVITSALPNIFSAGIDFKELNKPDPQRLASVWTLMQEVNIKLMTASFVTAVAINGHTSAGGYVLAAATDYRVAVAGGYTMGFNDTAVGIVPPVWVTKLMLHTMTPRKGEMAVMASTLFSPKKAVEEGLVDELASDKNDAVEKCKTFIKSMKHIAPAVISKTRQITKEAPLSWLLENRQKDCDVFVKKMITPESQQIMEDYLNKMKNKKRTKF